MAVGKKYRNKVTGCCRKIVFSSILRNLFMQLASLMIVVRYGNIPRNGSRKVVAHTGFPKTKHRLKADIFKVFHVIIIADLVSIFCVN